MSVPPGFERVSRRRPCPVCARPDWCLVAIDNSLACCKRPWDAPPDMKYLREFGDAGSLFLIGSWDDAQRTLRRDAGWKPEADPTPDFDAPTFAAQCARSLSDLRLNPFAESIGVSPESLRRLGIGWSTRHRAYTFPMRNAEGRTVGIRLRREDGSKYAVRGSRNGLFFDPMNRHGDPVFLPEGPTDTAALLDLELTAIGRPSCNSGTNLIVRMARGSWNAVVVADHDDAGLRGAERLARCLSEVCRSVRIIEPIHGKDARDWKRHGLARDAVLRVVRNSPCMKVGA